MSKKLKSQLKPFLADVASHPQFSPEIARRLGDPLFTKELTLTKAGLEKFVSHPVELLCEIIRTIDPGSRSALALVFMRGGQLPSPVNMTDDEERAVALLGGSISIVRGALNALDGSLILRSIQGGIYSWKFKHPTIRDAFATVIAEDRELLDIYLAGAPTDRLFNEVTCGDIGIQGVKVIVPLDRYQLLLDRLENFDVKKPENERKLHRFLAYRCDREFLTLFIAKFVNFISTLKVGSYLDSVSDVPVIVRLHEFALLPETKRVSVVAIISELAIETPDSGFLNEAVRALFKHEEYIDVLNDVRTKLVPGLGSTIKNWRDSYYQSDEDPQSYFAQLEITLRVRLKNHEC